MDYGCWTHLMRCRVAAPTRRELVKFIHSEINNQFDGLLPVDFSTLLKPAPSECRSCSNKTGAMKIQTERDKRS